jgi:NADH-quinone oxidoreductase subunit L
VSALIHAATMVTAGVYLIARSHAIFDASDAARTVVVCIGALTLLIGCIIGCAKDDIKRVLAYSTVSQIGYMFLAVGLGGVAYALGLIHLLAHGFFKAGLFLGAGSVMHGMNDQTDIRRFGGLRKYMPITWATTGLGFLAIIGIPPLSGFFSKEPIIAAAYDHEGWLGPVLGTAALIGSGLTAFYMTRLFVLTFHGPERWTDDVKKHPPHESKPVMTVPLILLAVGSVGAGFLLSTSVVDWLTPTFGELPEHGENWLITGLTMLVTVAGAGLAIALFRNGTALEEQPAGALVTAARNNLYADTFNEAVFEAPGRYLTRALVYLDNRGIDGLVNGLAAAVGGGSSRLRRAQTGFVRSYALSILGGALLVVAAMLAVTFG